MDRSMQDTVAQVLHRHAGQAHRLVQILREVQEHTHWLPAPVLEQVAQGVGLGSATVRGVASFYRFFHLQPVGRYHLLWSDNTTDRMLGSRTLAEQLCSALGVQAGAPAAPDALASVGYTSCTGLGDQGPALLLVQQQVLTRMDGARVQELAQRILAQAPPNAWPEEWMQVEDRVRRADVLLGSPVMEGSALRAVRGRGAQATLDELAASNLRGRGGAGFPTARKWQACRDAPLAPGHTRVVVCNADEGEPGTFKDRVLLSRKADTVFEGMTVAARVLGARTGFLYLRGEYRYLLPSLQAVLVRRRKHGLLGPRILGVEGFDFDIDIHVGAGAYVCGEESALIESLEGKRGTPR
ncbi:MAG: NAD(P)H-dependent oxidoreductase subunit E, partial [Giesbergeria sp.]